MKRLFALTACLVLAAPAWTAGLEDMTEAERAAFRAEVRAYLMDNPEVLMEAIAILGERQDAVEADAAAMAIAANGPLLRDSASDWSGGNPDGDVVVVEFLDYRCGFCRRAHPDVAALLAGDGNIRLVVKEFPILGAESLLASRFAIATRVVSGDDAYKAVHDALIEMRGPVTAAALTALAADIGLDPVEILAAMDDPIVTETLRGTRDLAARLGISGTPSFIFGDRLVRGHVPLDDMIELVAELRAAGN